MATNNGYDGNLTWAGGNSNNTTNVYNFTLDCVTDALETTDFASTGDRTYIPGLSGATGSFDIRLDDTNTLPAQGVAATEMVFTNVMTGGTPTFTFDAFRTGLSLTNSVDGIPMVTISFQVDDGVTISIA